MKGLDRSLRQKLLEDENFEVQQADLMHYEHIDDNQYWTPGRVKKVKEYLELKGINVKEQKRLVELDFIPGQKVWMMYDNRVTEAPVSEIHLHKTGKVKYYFWHQDFRTRDKSICYQNLFHVERKKLFVSKEALLNSL